MEVVKEVSELSTVRPLGDRILVLPDIAKKITDGGIVIPDTLQEKPPCGVIVKSGDLATVVSVGERIMYGKYCGVDVEFDGVVYLAIRVSDIIAVL